MASANSWGHPLYRRWTSIQSALTNPNNRTHKAVQQYGLTCQWTNFSTFAEDIEYYLGLPQQGQLLIRKDQTKGWQLGNLEWGFAKARGNRQVYCRFFKFKGQTRTLTQWAESNGVNTATAYSRLVNYNWPWKEAVGLVPHKDARIK